MYKSKVTCWTMGPTGIGQSGYPPAMIILGIILVIIGALLNIGLLYALGGILLIVGVILWILGAVGRPVAGRRYYY
jgi:vacuolar-type H+-ATPase subunit I/STV1